MKTLGVVGVGYWGKNLIRVFSKIADIKTCVHTGNTENEQWLKENFPSILTTTSYKTILEDPEIDAVIIATPIDTHYELTKQALCSGKNVFVEKPLARTAEQAKELTDLSEENQITLFVGYIFCYHPTLKPIFEQIEEQSIKWARFSWDKLGEFERDIFLDLVVHPVAIALELFSTYPDRVDLINTYSVTDKTDIVLIRMVFPDNRMFDIEINRLSPNSQKSLQILLEDRLYFWSENSLHEFHNAKFELVKQTNEEPLLAEAKQFIYEINQDPNQQSNTDLGYKVNKVIHDIHKGED
jgi:UDP-2-acetamido-3-amino-2,3-dideoxy-glucuronate N-acetyltransferase